MKLYELTDEIRLIESMMEDEDCDIESFTLALDGLNEEKAAKLANIGLLVKEANAEVAARKEAIKHLQDQNKSSANRIDWLKGYISAHFDEKVKTPLVSINMQKGREALKVQDATLLPDNYFKEPEPDAALIKQAIKDGYEVPGAEMVRGSDFVVIR